MTHYTEVLLYGRFSTREQREGMSIKRQLDDGKIYCLQHGLTPTGTIFDEGLSGFHGRHRSHGALGQFEAEAVAGLHHDALLVVERIDRLSREGHRETTDLINRLTRAGVTIASVKNGKLYEAGKEIGLVDSITLLVEADLAHQESVVKSERTASNWKLRQERAAKTGTAMSGTVCPPWLMVVDGCYQNDPDKLPYLKTIFRLADDGLGASKIVRVMNLNHAKPTGWSNRQRVDICGRWQRSEIIAILANRAVIGEHQKKRRGGKLLNDGPPIPGFYPVAIDPALFERVRMSADVRKEVKGGAKSGLVTNLLTGLVSCEECGGKVHLQSGYLYCPAAKERSPRCSNREGVKYKGKSGEGVEKALLDEVLHLAMDDRAFADADETAKVMTALAEAKRAHQLAREEAMNLMEVFANDPDPDAKVLMDRKRRKRDELAVEIATLEAARDTALGRADSAEHLRRIADVRANMTDPTVRLKVAHSFRSLIDHIWIKGRTATVSLNAGRAAMTIVDGKTTRQTVPVPLLNGDLEVMAANSGKPVAMIREVSDRIDKTLAKQGALGFAGATDAVDDFTILRHQR